MTVPDGMAEISPASRRRFEDPWGPEYRNSLIRAPVADNDRAAVRHLTLRDDDLAAIEAVLRSGWFRQGPRSRVRAGLREHLGVRHASPVGRCTAALSWPTWLPASGRATR